MTHVILLVDREIHVRHIISYKLRREGFITHSVSSPDEAKRVLDQNRIDLVLMDIALPTPIEGFKLAQHIRQRDDSTLDLPLIILSAQCSETDIRRSNEITASGYITKPFSLKFVIRKIKAILHA